MEDTNESAPAPSPSRPPSGVMSILAEGWQSKENIKNYTYLRYAFLFFVTFLLAIISLSIQYYIFGFETNAGSLITKSVINIITGLISLMILVPLNVICIRNAIRLSLDRSTVKKQCRSVFGELLKMCAAASIVGGLALYGILYLGAVTLPLPLYIFSMILAILMYAYLFLFMNVLTLPHMVLSKMNMNAAFISSFKKFKRNFWLFNGVYGLMGLIHILISMVGIGILIVGLMFQSILIVTLALTLFVAPALWILPWMYAVNGIVFRDVYGLKVSDQPVAATRKSNSTYYLLAVLMIVIALFVTVSFKVAAFVYAKIMFLSDLNRGQYTQTANQERVDASEVYKRAVMACFNARNTVEGCNEGTNGIPAGIYNQGMIMSLTVKDGVITITPKHEEGETTGYYMLTPKVSPSGTVRWETSAGISPK